MLTFTGVHITKEFGAPTIRDIAVQSMRLVRFSGAAEVFWPIGMHMMLVADLMPDEPWADVIALLHDAAEVAVADVPVPMKTDQARLVEQCVQERIHAALGVPAPSPELRAELKKADLRAALAEGALGCAGRGFQETQTGFAHDEVAERVLRKYLAQFNPMDALNADGRWALMYERRLRKALRKAQSGVVSYGLAA